MSIDIGTGDRWGGRRTKKTGGRKTGDRRTGDRRTGCWRQEAGGEIPKDSLQKDRR